MYTIRQISLKGYFMFHTCTKKHKNNVLCTSILVNTNFVRKQKERERNLSPMRIVVPITCYVNRLVSKENDGLETLRCRRLIRTLQCLFSLLFETDETLSVITTVRFRQRFASK